VQATGAIFTRAGIALVALAACAWLLIQYHNAELTASLKRITLTPDFSAGQTARAIRDAGGAGTLNPDPYEVRVYQALAEVRVGERRTAITRLESVVRDQPSYLEAWAILAKVSEGTDPQLSKRATARVLALDPRAGTLRRR
jgi:predicted Zn-dependent protease